MPRQCGRQSGESASARGSRREKILRKSESQLARRGVSVQGGDEDALSGGADEAEDQPVDDRDPEAHDQADHTTEEEPQEGREERREREQHDDPAEREVSARRLAPCLSQQRSASLHRSPRSDLLEDQDRDDEVRDDSPGRAEGSRDDPSQETESLGDRAQDEADRRGHQSPSGDAPDVLSRDLQAVGDRRVAAVQSNHGGAHHGGVEVDRDEERDEVDDREAQVEQPESEHIRGSGEEEDRDEERDPDGTGDQEREEREEDQPLLLAKDAEADLRELPTDPQTLEESRLARCRRIRPGRDGRRGSPHGNRSLMPPLHLNPPAESPPGEPGRGGEGARRVTLRPGASTA